jgi:hypothetical protein
VVDGTALEMRRRGNLFGGSNPSLSAKESAVAATFEDGPYTPSIKLDLKQSGAYLFCARLVEAPSVYNFGCTGNQAGVYEHMTRGGT